MQVWMMERYVAFLRGINISGKNKIEMKELKNCFEKVGFSDVSTYLNSGNVTFSTDESGSKTDMEGLKKDNHQNLIEGFTEGNSRNLIEEFTEGNSRNLIEKIIREDFGLDIPVYVIKNDELKSILENAPSWWGTGDKTQYDNLIFILSDDKADDLCKLIGEPSEELEKIQVYHNVIFWTFDRSKYQKCNWWKETAKTGMAERLTIRTANTIKKVCK